MPKKIWEALQEATNSLGLAFAAACGLGWINGSQWAFALHIMFWPSLVAGMLFAALFILRFVEWGEANTWEGRW